MALKRAWNVWKRDFLFDVFLQSNCQIYHFNICWCYSVCLRAREFLLFFFKEHV